MLTFRSTGLFSLLLALAAFWILNDTPAKITKWLTPEEKKFLILRNRYAAGGETGIAEKEEFSWQAVKDAFTVCSLRLHLICSTQLGLTYLQSFHIYAV